VLGQGRDASGEIEAALAESRDPFWQEIPPDRLQGMGPERPESVPPIQAQVLDRMIEEVSAHTARFPDRAGRVAPFAAALAAERTTVTEAPALTGGLMGRGTAS